MKGGDKVRTVGSRSQLCGCMVSMRRMLISFCVFTAIAAAGGTVPTAADAAHATLSWTTPDTRTDGSRLTDLAGYRIYVGTVPGSYGGGTDAGYASSYFIDNLYEGTTYYFAVTAYDSAGVESPFSNEVAMTFPAAASGPSTGTPYGIADALSALRHATGLEPLSSAQTARLDVAPLAGDGKPHPDGTVDVADAMIILKNAVGLLSW